MFQFRHGCRYLLLQALDETPVTVNIFSTVSASVHHSFKVRNPGVAVRGKGDGSS